MTKVSITIEIDDGDLARRSDEGLALYWHVAQANPAAHGDKDAGEVAERIGREIIRRWLGGAAPALWTHQGRDHYRSELCKLGKWNADQEFVPSVAGPAGQADADTGAGR
jgi:hypothetical protein